MAPWVPRGDTVVRAADALSVAVRAAVARPVTVFDFTADVVRVAGPDVRVVSDDALFPRAAVAAPAVTVADVRRVAARATDASSSAMAP